ncbi:hypothetical protein D9756_010940 [Leucocoprinus leucothites]|uniref:Uncharacterized protein n=1 Tax=Leucocoprinus leucothites TaxID=201217 RepID=A0A8H5CU55_9AGAR|nr:hypothetical protein D9756_010940 [Leucoagaricus leucothites]
MGDTLWTLKYQTLLLMATGRYNLCNHKVVEESPPNKEAGGSDTSSVLQSQNHFELLSALTDNKSVGNIHIGNDTGIVEQIIFAINPLDEPNEHLSPEQLEGINQATAGLSEEQ